MKVQPLMLKLNHRLRCILCVLVVTLFSPARHSDAESASDEMGFDLPTLDLIASYSAPSVIEFDPTLTDLWLKALARPEVQYRLSAADAFLQLHREDLTDLPAFGPQLVEAFNRETVPEVRRSLALTLSEIDPASLANIDFTQVSDPAVLLISDPVLAQLEQSDWDEAWRSRLTDAQVSDAVRLSAARALATRGDTPFLASAAAIAGDRAESVMLRLGVADAVFGRSAQPLADVGRAMAEGDAVDRLIAPPLLSGQGSAVADVLQSLLDDSDGAVAARALAALRTADPGIAATAASTLITHADAAVRLEAVLSLTPAATTNAIQLWADAMGDRAEVVRVTARRQLERSAESGHDAAVKEQLQRVLASQAWRSLQQASLLAASIQATEAANLIVPLLDHNRPEVRHAAAGALRSLGQSDTCAAMLSRVEQLANSDDPVIASDQAAATQLILALGELRYTPSNDVLLKRLPKEYKLGGEARRAAAWSLGLIHEGQPNGNVVKALASRANDRNMMEPEDEGLQVIAIDAIAKINPDAAPPILQRNYRDANGPMALQYAARMLLVDTFGQDLPEWPVSSSATGPWFLEPAN